MKKIAILGSTGSIGTQTLDVVRKNKDIEVLALAAGSNVKVFVELIKKKKTKQKSKKKEDSISDL